MQKTKSKVVYLIDPAKFEKRNSMPQKDFESKNYEFLKFFEELVYSSFEDLHSKILSLFKPGEYDNNLPAVAMISFLRKGIIKSYPEYCRLATSQRFKLVTDNNQYLFIKKLDENYMPMNIQTNNNDLILHQCTEGDDANPYIFLGYTTEDNFSAIKGVFAVCIIDKKVYWRTDISNLSDESGRLFNINTTPINPKLKDGVVRIKTSRNG